MSDILKGHKPFEVKAVNGQMMVGWKRLPRKVERELIDTLRKCLLYQTPRAEFQNPADEFPRFCHVKLPYKHWKLIMEIIGKAGGWTMPKEKREAFEKAAQAMADREAAIAGDEFDCPNDMCTGKALAVDLFSVECATCNSKFRNAQPLDGGPMP